MRDELRRIALFGSGVAELTRHRAEQMVKELVKAGDIRREQTSSMVRELLERNRQSRRELVTILRSEIENQITNLGLATKRDVQRLERRVARMEERAKKARATGAKTTAKKTTARRSTSTDNSS